MEGAIKGAFGHLTIWLFNIAMENDPFIDEFPIKTSIYSGFSMAMFNNQMVTLFFGVKWYSPQLCGGQVHCFLSCGDAHLIFLDSAKIGQIQ